MMIIIITENKMIDILDVDKYWLRAISSFSVV